MERQFKRILKGILIALFAFTMTFTPVFASEDDADEDIDDDVVTEEVTDEVVHELPPQSDFEENRDFMIETSGVEIDGHRLIAQNENLELYLKEATLSIIIRNRATGAVMYGAVDEPDPGNNQIWQDFMQSGVVIQYLTDNHVHPTNVTLLEPDAQTSVTVTADGFTADVYFPNLQLGYTLHVTLTDTGIIAEVPDESWIEAGENLISGLYIFPFLGYTHLGNRDGYMFVPDGSGILINLENNNRRYSQPFRGMVFGENVGITTTNIPTLLRGRNVIQEANQILMPVFGMVHTDSEMGFLGIIEGGGEFNAVIEAYPNGAITQYDWITTRFVYRQSFTQSMGVGGGSLQLLQNARNNFDARIRFEIVTGDDANYTGLARAYRNYLLETGQLVQAEEDFRVRLDFLGLEQESGMIFNRNVVMTTVEDIREIQERLAAGGAHNILGIYRGWQNNGLSVGTMVRNFRTASSLGGNRELTRLLRDLEDTPMDLHLHNDALRINASGTSPLRFSAIRQINRQIYEEMVYQPVVGSFNFLQPDRLRSIFEGLKNSYASNDVEHIMVGGISNQLFSHAVSGTLHGRVRTATTFQEIIGETNESFNMLLEQPFAYLWPYTRAFIDTPVRGSNYVFTYQEVPFLAIVLRGIIPMYSEPINFEANRREFFLQLVEQGVRPTFYITMESPELLKHTNSHHIFTSQFDRFEERIITYYHELGAIYALTQGATIESHVRVGDLVIVEYSNGVIIYVNYGQTAQIVNGVRVEPLSYQVDISDLVNVRQNEPFVYQGRGGETP